MAYIGVQGEDAAAYSSRNAVSLAFAAVFLTAAKALGSNNAMRASFIVDLRDDALRDCTWKMCRQPISQTRQFCARPLAAKFRGSKSCVISNGDVQSMNFGTAWHDFCELHLELAALVRH